jgi:hypothetical protein
LYAVHPRKGVDREIMHTHANPLNFYAYME